MSRLKIQFDPMPMMRIQAIARVNEHFNRRFHERAHIDHAHGRKRQVAAAVMAGEAIADDHPFVLEAAGRGMNKLDFAQVIANKPDNISKREWDRQQAIAKIETAEAPSDIETILSKIG
jgi:hypothetical protein